ncbi:MAG: hypothetical protein IKL53_08685 [Lachnospiraceae bacterium]|nr:hypothetical protein [Lachnospiraceae bacterium]
MKELTGKNVIRQEAYYNQVYRVKDIIWDFEDNDNDEMNHEFKLYCNVMSALKLADYLEYVHSISDLPEDVAVAFRKLYLTQLVSIMETLIERSVERLRKGRCNGCIEKEESSSSNKCRCYFPTVIYEDKGGVRVKHRAGLTDFIDVMERTDMLRFKSLYLNGSGMLYYEYMRTFYKLRNQIHLSNTSKGLEKGYILNDAKNFSETRIQDLRTFLPILAERLLKYVIPGGKKCLKTMNGVDRVKNSEV